MKYQGHVQIRLTPTSASKFRNLMRDRANPLMAAPSPPCCPRFVLEPIPDTTRVGDQLICEGTFNVRSRASREEKGEQER